MHTIATNAAEADFHPIELVEFLSASVMRPSFGTHDVNAPSDTAILKSSAD